ncbi:MAG: hypothetical protein HRU34_02550 [Richelia sp.]|nr:hypothetical protein [Richelia sp.]CDN13268.1 hypothetical protein RintRC_5340 [Richelia intracellularis]
MFSLPFAGLVQLAAPFYCDGEILVEALPLNEQQYPSREQEQDTVNP